MKSTTPSLALVAGALTMMLSTPADAQAVRNSDRNPLDTNQDGLVDQEEFIAAKLSQAQRRFSRLDRNNDGLVTPEDIEDLPEPPDVDREALRACIEETLAIDLPEPPEAGTRFDSADLNSDGAISLDEALTGAETVAIERFVRLDNNADGLLQRSEVRKARRRAANVRKTRRECLEEQTDITAMLGG